MAKVETLKGQKTTPTVLLHQLLERMGEKIKNVAVVVEFQDGSVDVEWSDMDIADLCLLSDYLKTRVILSLAGDPEDR